MIHRNGYLRTSAMLAMALAVLPSTALPANTGAQSVFPFPLKAVKPQPGTPYSIALNNKILPWLKAVDADRVLYIWRQAYGLPTGNAQALGNWEAPYSLLRGHFTGHVLSALALTYSLSGDAALKTKAAYMVRSLDTCQRRATTVGLTKDCLNASGEGQFIAIEGGASTAVWAPWYTSHKILAGLLDCYREFGDTVALRVAKNMGYWAYNRLKKVPADRLFTMWEASRGGESGGFNESAADLYFLTGDTTFRTLARFFDDYDKANDGAAIPNLVANVDLLGTASMGINVHSNTNIPRMLGYLRLFDAYNADSAFYLTASKNFFSMIDNHHRFCNGGVSGSPVHAEYFLPNDGEFSQINTEKNSESCASYNMIKLCKTLFYHDPSAKYWDLADRSTENRILRNYNVVGSPNNTTTWSTYFCSPRNNAPETVDNSDLGGGNATCCGGTNLESAEKAFDGNFAYAGDTLYINSFIGSTLTWAAKGVAVVLQTMFPESDNVTITVMATGTVNMPIKIRAPYWKRKAWTITVNGTDRNAVGPGIVNGKIPPSSYFLIGQGDAGSPVQSQWTGTSSIVLVVPQSPRFELAKGSTTTGAIFFGPSVMTTPGGTDFAKLNASSWSRSSATSATITMGGVTLTPWYRPPAAHNTYVTPTNIPASWDSVVPEKLVPTGVIDRAHAVSAAFVPSVHGMRSRLVVFCPRVATSDREIEIRLLNAQGVSVWNSTGTLHPGERSIDFGIEKSLSAGLYVCHATFGARSFQTLVTVSK